jgi:branched-subunit amino acid aminotransferase/4-amino-4-deoxychorismate lyase
MAYVIYNGKLLREEDVSISFKNRAFRYADGFFETMRVYNGTVLLQNLHFERLYRTLEELKFEPKLFPTPILLQELIKELSIKNGCASSGRIRLTFFGGEGFLHDLERRNCNYIVESSALPPPAKELQAEGLSIGIFKDAVKAFDRFSSLKSNNFLPYVMASIWANENGFNDALLINPNRLLADTTIANIFIVVDGYIKTPPLTDGCVSGVMRKHLMLCFSKEGIPFKEESVTLEDIATASEVFLTNAVFGIKWVKQIGSSNYGHELASRLYKQFIVPLTGA